MARLAWASAALLQLPPARSATWLAEQGRDVALDGAHRYAQLLGDLGVGRPAAEHRQDLRLPCGDPGRGQPDLPSGLHIPILADTTEKRSVLTEARRAAMVKTGHHENR